MSPSPFQHSSSSSSGSSSGLVPLALSIGVFVATVAVSQWLKSAHEYRLYDELEKEERRLVAEERYHEQQEEELRQWYYDRRLHDRLSYEDLSKSLNVMDPALRRQQQQQAAASAHHFADVNNTNDKNNTTTNNNNNNNNNRTEDLSRKGDALFQVSDDGVASLFGGDKDPNKNRLEGDTQSNGRTSSRQRNKGTEKERLSSSNQQDAKTTTTKTTTNNNKGDANAKSSPDKKNLPDVHPNEYFDFHPKNRNWSHFERASEEDRQARAVKSGKDITPLSSSFVVHHSIFNDGSEVDIQNNVAPSSDDDSDSSEEDFVWTSSQRGLKPELHKEATTPRAGDRKGRGRQRVTTLLSAAEDKNMSAQVFHPQQYGVRKNHRSHSESAAFGRRATSSSQSRWGMVRGLPTVEEQRAGLTSSTHTNNNDDQHSLAGLVSSSDHRRSYMAPRPSLVQHSVSLPLPTTPRRSLSSPNLSLMERWLSFGIDDSMSSMAATTTTLAERPPTSCLNHRTVRAQYNARIMPEKVVMIRHGQSLGNINEAMYATTPDNAMPLTDLGWDQARLAGKVLKEKVISSGETVHFIVSPYVRTVETFHGLVSAWCDPREFSHIRDRDARVKAWYGRLMEMGLTWNEDSRIREQDFGNYQVGNGCCACGVSWRAALSGK
jgi:hypothetical protein